ncbi:methyl-accepting chemotaxis protein [Thiopseudomonas acetoxidans]|uniref:Methyl-accepting chemotaxis protein n=1 Tax=Thiopseudomonas acetoxidans TaxID=3041622 RepID=A0ABT7SRX2_9GAMM|nr:methyl-accepting chemotaxis protein [Thiopseudomonas sp. CY1220]MDM7858941.1 methyl-accepting chemotaxis protein [Thiopseudomonas sp. CY1220]
MFSSFTFQQRLLATIILSGSVFLLFGLLYTLDHRAQLAESTMLKHSEAMQVVLNERIKSKEEFGLGLAVMLANNPLVPEYLAGNSRDKALTLLSGIIKNYAETTNYRGLKIQIHTAEGRSWLRSWDPANHGDDLLFRPSIQKIIQEQKPFASSTETGLVGFAIRGVAPIFMNGEYLGSLEVLQGVGSVSRDFEADGQAYIMLLNKNVLRDSPSLAQNKSVANYVLPNDAWFNERALDFAKSLNLDALDLRAGQLNTELNDQWFATQSPVIDLNGELIGVHIIGEPAQVIAEQVKSASAAAWMFMLMLGLLILGMGVMVAWQVQRGIVGPITRFQQQLGVIADSLDLTKRITTQDRGSLGALAAQTNNLLVQLETAVKGVHSGSDQISATAKDLAMTAGLVSRSNSTQLRVTQSMAAAVEQMSSSVAEITSTMEELSASSTQIADYSHVVVDVANQTLDSSKKGADTMQNLQERMADIHQDSAVSLQEILQLGHQSKAISKVMDLINDLADQTKLIAFNAALEASSAGESGKRFSVVASEIRRLADSVTDSTFEIEGRIQEVQDSINRLVITSEKGSTSIQQGMQLSSETAHELSMLVDAASKTSNAAKQISLSTQQQKTASNQVVIALHDIANASSHNAQSVRDITNISEDMLKMSQHLHELVNEFRVGEA